VTTPVAQTGAGNVTIGSTSLSSTVTCNKPSNTADGDLLVAAPFGHKGAGTWSTVPAGWNALSPLENASGTMEVFAKPIPSAAAETATSYSWVNSAGSDRGLVMIFRVTGADLAAPLDVAGTWITSGATSIVTPGITPNYANSLLLGFWQASNAGATASVITAPTGMTEVGNVSVTPTASSYLEVSQAALGAAGVATGNKAPAVSPSAVGSCGILLAISGPAVLSGALSGSSSLTGALSVGAAQAGSLTGKSGLTANLNATYFMAASLSASSNFSASPLTKPLNVLRTDGTWAPVTPEVLTGSGWQS
jgi:hypothetical protein